MPDFSDFTLTMVHGTNYTISFTVTIDGAVTNITSWLQFWFTGKIHVADTDVAAVFQKTKTGGSGGITVTNGPAGIGQVALGPGDTSGQPNARANLFCELQGKDAGGLDWTLARGMLILEPQVTLAT